MMYNLTDFEVGDWVKIKHWPYFMEVVEIDRYKLKIQYSDGVVWYDTRDDKFMKRAEHERN